MIDSLYIATNENASGKRMVALGVMELAMRHYNRVVYFRPFVKDRPEDDQSIRLMRSRYKLSAIPAEMTGLTRAEARQLLAADRYGELIQRIQQRYKTIQANADFAVVEGSSFQGLAPEVEFELNADLAVNLGCAILPVYLAAGRSIEEVLQSTRIGNDSLTSNGGQIFGTVVNQVQWDPAAEYQRRFSDAGLDAQSPFYFIPDEPLLRQPTIREIQAGLNATVVGGDESTFDREVTHMKVAAMQLPSFLERLVQGSLVITPGDRTDILAGCVLASQHSDVPSPAGIVLTGGLVLSPAVSRLVCSPHGLPILMTDDDTFTAARKVSAIRAEIGMHSPRKVESAIGLFEKHVDGNELAQRLQAPTGQRVVTPLMFEYSLIQRARARRVRIVLPEGTEPRILQAVDVLLRRDVADIVLLGDPAAVRSAASKVGVTLPDCGLEIIDPMNSELHEEFAQEYLELRRHKGMTLDVARDRMQEVSYFGTMMVRRGLAGGMVSGAVHTTADTIRPAFEFIKTRPGVKVVSSVFLMCLRTSVLVYGDCAVIVDPDEEALAEIACSSADTARQFGIEPRIAMLSYSTGESGHGADVTRVRRATQLVRDRCPEILIEGPIQYDAAIDPAVAATKLPGSPVAGRATVLIFPDLNTGNNTYKAVQRSAGAVAIGPVLQGLNKPVNDLSRGCTVADIVNTVAITAIQAQEIEAVIDAEVPHAVGEVS